MNNQKERIKCNACNHNTWHQLEVHYTDIRYLDMDEYDEYWDVLIPIAASSAMNSRAAQLELNRHFVYMRGAGRLSHTTCGSPSGWFPDTPRASCLPL